VNLSVTESVFAATGWDSRYAPNLIQQELVRAGRYGRKSGRGFYDYREGAKPPHAAPVTPATNTPRSALMVRAGDQSGALSPLVERLRFADIAIETDRSLAPETLRIGEIVVALSDGRTLAERHAETAAPMLLLDLARDYSTTNTVGATGSADALAQLAAVLQPAQIELIALADVAGLVLMRTVACLANEAADVMTWTGTTAVDIDIAMRLGTAYPIGPLAWADAIGVSRVVQTLANLQAHYGDARYRCSPLLSAKHHAKASFHG